MTILLLLKYSVQLETIYFFAGPEENIIMPVNGLSDG